MTKIHFTVNDKAILQAMGEILGSDMFTEPKLKILEEILDGITPMVIEDNNDKS